MRDFKQQSSNLTLRRDVDGRGEVADTARAFNTLLEHQQSLIRHLTDTAIQLATSAEEMSEISQNINGLNDSISEVVSGAEQSSLASRDLAQLASGLQQQIQRFTA
jgi:methyl-accepting chemotaxis protein